MKTFAKVISTVFHPLFVPVYLLAITLWMPVYAFQRYNSTLKFYILGYVFLINVVIPISSLLLMKRYKIISSLQIEEAEERTIPYWLMFFLYSITAYSMGNIPGIHPIIPLAFILSAMIVVVVVFINRFLKISAHSTSMAASATWFFLLFKAFDLNTVIYLIAGVLLTGMVMSARLEAEAHSPREVYLGAATGMVLTLVLGQIFIF